METTLHFPGHTAWSLAVVSLLAGAGVAVLLWRLRPGRGRRLVTGLRLAALGGVLLAYFQPAIRVEEVLRARSPVLVVVDESASMQAKDAEGRPRSESVAEFFRRHSEWSDEMEQRHDVRWFACSDHARPVGRAAIEAPLPPRGSSTELRTCIEEAMVTAGSREVGGIVVVTDGADPGLGIGGRPDPPSPTRSPAPLWVLLVSTPDESFRDVAIAEVGGLDFLLVRNLAEVHVQIASAGVGAHPVVVKLSLDGEVVDSKEVLLPPADGNTEVTLSFLPREPGRHLLEIEVSVLEGEASEENNRSSLVVTVVRDRLRVLHVAGHPSWDERFLRETLRKRRGVELISFHTLRDPETALDLPDDGETLLIPFPAEEIFVRSIQSFDLVVLQDYELPEADRDRLAASLERYVREGGALLFIGGSSTLGAQGPWPEHLATLLPVPRPSAPRRGMMLGRFQATVPIWARGHPVFNAGPAGSLIERIKTAPPLSAIHALDGAARGGEVLIEVAGDGSSDTGPWPLVVVMGRDKGLVGLVATDTLWRWAFDPGAGRLYSDLVNGLIAFLAKDPDASKVRVRVDRDLVAPGHVFGVEVTAGSDVGEVSARIERLVGPGAFEPLGVEGKAVSDAEGRAVIRFVADGYGPRRVKTAIRASGEEHEATDVFVVGPQRREMLHLRPTGRTAQALVQRFGGEVHPLSAPELDRFRPRGDFAIRTGARVEFPIWDHPSVLLLILTALGLEWYLERRLGQA